MAEGKVISYEQGEYPELDGLSEGAMIKFEGMGQLVKGGIQINSIEMEPSDNEATKEMSRMAKQDNVPSMKSDVSGGSQGF
jgi:molybdopterin synthase catalytic subunit